MVALHILAIALAKLMEKDGEVYPISHIHKEDDKGIKALLKPYPAIKTNGISTVMTIQVRLYF